MLQFHYSLRLGDGQCTFSHSLLLAWSLYTLKSFAYTLPLAYKWGSAINQRVCPLRRQGIRNVSQQGFVPVK